MTAKTKKTQATEQPAPEQEVTPAEAGEAAAKAETKTPKPLDEKTAKTREANAALKDAVKDQPTLTLTSPDDAQAYGTRFSDRVKVLAAPDGVTGDCWIWFGSYDYDGYPVFQDTNKKRWMAARYAVSIATGQLPSKGANLRHACKRHGCVNPAHMLTQTPAALKEQPTTEQPAAEQETANV